MANNPNPEFLEETMFAEFGTKVLITNPKSDLYLKKASENKTPQKYSQWCGGENGWDDYTERWHVE